MTAGDRQIVRRAQPAVADTRPSVRARARRPGRPGTTRRHHPRRRIHPRPGDHQTPGSPSSSKPDPDPHMAPGRVLSGGLWRVHRLPPHGYVDECSTYGTGTSSRYVRYGLVGAGAAPGGGIATSAGAARENRPSDVPPNVRGASTSYPRELSLSRAIQARNPYRPALDLAPVRCWGSRIGEKARVGARRRCIVGPTRPFPSAAAQPLTLRSRPRRPHIGRGAEDCGRGKGLAPVSTLWYGADPCSDPPPQAPLHRVGH